MTVPCFVDTTVFVYSIDARDTAKKAAARELIGSLMKSRSLVLSTQVLVEFFHAATRKLGYPAVDALAAMDSFASGDVVATTAELVKSAAEVSIIEQLSIWDSLIVTAAIQRRCPVLYSEDLGTERRIRGVEIRNPFT